MSFMETMKSTKRRMQFARTGVILLLAFAMLAGVGCSPKLIKGRPPFVSISDMRLDGDTLKTEFDISNQNEVTMTIESLDIVVKINTTELARYNSTEMLEITANGTEEVLVADSPDDFTRNLLTSLDDGLLNSLSFDLNATVMTLEDGRLLSEHKSYLYPVPGRPGQYRAAVTQAKGLVRDDNL